MLLLMMTSSIQAAAISKVLNLKMERQENVVSFYWDKVFNADGYDIFISTAGKEYQYIGSVTGTEARVIGFKKGVTYSAKVRAYQKKNNGTKITGNFSNAITVETTERTTLDKTKTLTASQTGGNVTLNWSQVSNATGYEVFVKVPNLDYISIGKVNTNHAVIINCKEGITYEFKVRAYKQSNSSTTYGEESPSAKISIHTKQNNEKYNDKIEAGAVKNLTAKVSGKSVTINWNKATNADGYGVYIKRENESYYHFTTNTTKTSLSTSKLDYNTEYTVKIVAYTENNGKLKYSNNYKTVKFTTEKKQISAAKNLTAEVKNRNEAYLQWWPVEGASGYEVYLSKENKTFQKVDDITKNYMTLYSDDLSYNTSYRVRVMAYEYVNGKKIYAEYSNIARFKTEKESPWENNLDVARVKNVKAKVTRDTVSLTWNKVTNAKYYEIALTIPGFSGETKFQAYTNSKTILGLTEKGDHYTARVRAYQYVDGRLVAGEYSEVVEFMAK